MRIVHERCPAIFRYQQVDVYGKRSHVEWSPRPDEWILLDEVTLRA